MLLTKQSMITGLNHTREIGLTQDQYDMFVQGKLPLIQHAFPRLNDDDRDFVMSGITPEEWDEYMTSKEDVE